MHSCRFTAPDALLAVAALLLDSGVAVLLTGGFPLLAGAAHCLVCGLLGGVLMHRSRRGADLRMVGLLTLTTTIAGPLGPAGTLLSMALQGGFGSADQPLEEWFASLAPAAGTTEVNSSHSEIESLPLIDVLTRGSESRRQAVVALVARHFRPPLAPVLRRALDDPSNAVRVQAATALARIESTFLRSALDLAAAHSAAPGDVSLYLAQARLNDEHAHTGLLDAVREAESRGRALQWYERYLEAVPGDNEARTAMARLLIRQRRYEDASRVLEQLAEGSSPPGAVLAWRLEAAFHLGQWDRVRLWARQWNGRCQDDAEIPIEMRQAVALWAGGAA